MAQRKFLSQVLTLVGGTGSAQVALICFSPVLSRLYSPEAFATYALFVVYTQLIAIGSSGRYEMAMMLPIDDSDALPLFSLAMLLPLIIAIGLYIFVAGGAMLTQGVSLWIWMVPIGAFLAACQNTVTKWQARAQRFKIIAISRFTTVVFSLLIQLTAGLLAGAGEGIYLVLGQMIGSTVAIGILSAYLGVSWLQISNCSSRDRLWAAARRYADFPIFSGTSSLIGKFNLELPKLLLSAFFAPHFVGCFALSSRVLATPTNLVGRAIGEVFFPRISAVRADPEETVRLMRLVCITCFALILVPSIVLFLWAEALFAIVFGEQWRDAGVFARLLVPMLVTQFVVQPVSLALHALEKQRAILAWQICSTMMLLASMLTGYFFQSANIAIFSYSITFAGLFIFYLRLSFHFARRYVATDASESAKVISIVGRAA